MTFRRRSPTSYAPRPGAPALAVDGIQCSYGQVQVLFDAGLVVHEGEMVALEVFWSGYLAIPVDTLPADSEMRAHFSMWLEFRDGKICRQHNYDCFDPWWV